MSRASVLPLHESVGQLSALDVLMAPTGQQHQVQNHQTHRDTKFHSYGESKHCVDMKFIV